MVKNKFITSRSVTLNIALALLVFMGASQAETGYVIDKLTIGIHADKSPDSPILKLFTTGDKFEVLKREGDFIQVRGPKGEIGWVEAGYLTMEEPARAVVERLEKRTSELETQLKAAQEKTKGQSTSDPQGPPPPSNEATLALSQQNETLKQQISAERLKVEQLQAKLAAAGKNATPSNSENEALLQHLRLENQALKESLTEAIEKIPTGIDSVANTILGNGYWIGLAILLLVASFWSGMYWVDRRRRKRYGGFRL
jgi:SH3 domain protein